MVNPKTMGGIISATTGAGRKKSTTFTGAVSSITINNMGEGATDLADVKTDIAVVKTDIAVVKTDIAVVKTDIADLKQHRDDSGEGATDIADIADVKTDIADVKTDIADVKTAITEVKTDISDVKTDMAELKQNSGEMKQDEFDEKLEKHIATSDNVFSIDNVNTLDNAYIRCINKLNFTLNLINENKTEIIKAKEYASVLRPIFEKKFTDNDVSIDGYVVLVTNEPVDVNSNKLAHIYFWEPDSVRENKRQWIDSDDTLLNYQRYNAQSFAYDETTELREKYPEQSMFYVISWYKWADSVKVSFNICIPDILNPDGPWIRLLSGVNITPYFPSIVSIDLLPQTYKTYLGKLQDAFNNYVATDYDPTLGTIYQFGENNDFNKLKVVSSKEYPNWVGGLIINAYIPGSNVDMPTIMYQINIQLNRQYTGMSDGEIVIVSYDIGHVYYSGVVKMLKIDGYDGLCYQIQSININDSFHTSVTMVGDVDIQGNLKVLNYNGEAIISSDNTRKVVSFHDKVGINQQPYEVNGLLDIDNLTQQSVLDLFDTFGAYRIISSDVIKAISQASASLPPGTPVEYAALSVKQLFSQGQPLFDYKNQCTVFAVPIKSIIARSEVVIIHADETVVGTGADGMTPSGRAASIISSESSLNRLQQVIKDMNQLAPEIMKANDPSFVFSFVELLTSLDTQSYITSSSVIIYDGLAIFAMTYLDVTSTMNDNSTGKPLVKILDYIGREMRLINYVSLLFKDIDLIDSDGKYTTDNNGIMNLQKSIKNNPYFSNRFDLLPESYVFSWTLNDKDRYLIHEGVPTWNGNVPTDLWIGDSNIQLVIDLINKQNNQRYGNRDNSAFIVNYRWRGGMKLSITNIVKVGVNSILIGSGFDLNSLLNQSMIVNGDNTISGNFFVNDSYNNNIFKVDNVKKTITNTYKVGIGIEEPKTVLDIKDTTVNDILKELDAGRDEYNLLNKIANKLRTTAANAPFNDSTDFGSIIDAVYKEFDVEQTIDNYTALLEVNMNTMLPGDIKICSQWLYSHWNGQYYKDIQDPVNQFALNQAKTQYTYILNNELIYNNALILVYYKWVFGWKFSRIKCLLINEKMYFLRIGTNIQSYGLRVDSNTNITKNLTNGIRGNMMTNRIYYLINNITNAANNIESSNELVRLNYENDDITLSNFILTVDTTNINATTKQDITLNTEKDVIFNIDILTMSTGNTIKIVDDSEYNNIVKYKNFWVMFNSKKYYDNLSINDFNVITYEDLYNDYSTGIKCIGKSGNKFTLLCSELRIQDVIQPSLSVEGDAKITGDLIIRTKSNDKNFVSIDPDNNFMGIGTDERFINYSDMAYSTTTSIYDARYMAHTYGSRYPIFVCQRLSENANDTSNNDTSLNNPRYFSTYTAITAKRTSNLYTFTDMDFYAKELQKTIPDYDTVSHMRYGADISFEISDVTDRTVEIGNVQMVIDRIDENNNLRGGFSIQVNDPGGEGRTFENSRRNLMYIDNNSQLFVKKINLNGNVLENDGSGNLLWNGGNVYNSSGKYPYQLKFPTKEQLEINLKNKFIDNYHQYVEKMILFFNDKLSNDIYMTLLDDYNLSNNAYQTFLVDMVNQYHIDNNPIRVQMVTVSGAIFADSKHPADTDVTSTSNIYNNPEIAQAILVGVGGTARCSRDEKILNICIGTENKWGTVVLTRLIMEVPQP